MAEFERNCNSRTALGMIRRKLINQGPSLRLGQSKGTTNQEFISKAYDDQSKEHESIMTLSITQSENDQSKTNKLKDS